MFMALGRLAEEALLASDMRGGQPLLQGHFDHCLERRVIVGLLLIRLGHLNVVHRWKTFVSNVFIT